MDNQAQRCQWISLGLMDYQEAWDLQCAFANEIAEGKCLPTLLLLEHLHTYTFGRGGQAQNLLWSEEELTRREVQVFWVDRGGDVTYHGPGQLVGYPLLPLAPVSGASSSEAHLPQADYVGYLRRLERVLIAALGEFGLPGCQAREGLTGVWVPGREPSQTPAKIASIGVKVDARGITRHGFALNVKPEMQYWQGIVSCGLAGCSMTSLAELVSEVPTMQEVEQAVAQALGSEFGYEMVEQYLPIDRFYV